MKRARFVVIKSVTVPGILVEGGFMSGTPDARLIATADYRQRIAQCILDGVNRYKAGRRQSDPKSETVRRRRRNRSHHRAELGENRRR